MFCDNLSFAILCTDYNPGAIKQTTNSLNDCSTNPKYYFVVPETFKESREMSKFGQIHIGGKSITSLINSAIKNNNREWTFLIFAGGKIKNGIFNKYNNLFKDDRNVIYSIFNIKTWRFEDSTINGLVISKKCLEEVGDFPEDTDNLQICKLHWATNAIEKQYKFMGIVGTKII